MSDLIRTTRGLTVREVRDCWNAVVDAKAPPTDTSLDDYREWCNREGPGELQASRYDRRTRERILERWKAVSG